MHVERLFKNMAAPSNSQGSASIKKGTVATEAKIVRKLARTDTIFNMADRFMNIQYKKRSCPLRPFSASGFKSASRVPTPYLILLGNMSKVTHYQAIVDR